MRVLLFFSLLFADEKLYKIFPYKNFEINSSFKSPFKAVQKIKNKKRLKPELVSILNGYAYIKNGKKALWYKKGDGIGGYFIEEIFFDKVVFSNGMKLKIKRH
ncbi:MAG: hypothetical protein ABGX25_03850 [Nautiliaceae bacterium]